MYKVGQIYKMLRPVRGSVENQLVLCISVEKDFRFSADTMCRFICLNTMNQIFLTKDLAGYFVSTESIK